MSARLDNDHLEPGPMYPLAAIARELGIDLLGDEVQLVTSATLAACAAVRPFEGGMLAWSPLRPVLVVDQAGAGFGRDVVGLMRYVACDSPVRCLIATAPDTLTSRSCSLDAITSLVAAEPVVAILVPRQDPLVNGSDPRSLQHIVAVLRDEDGCPWDRKQTISSLRGSFIDEVYEVIDAIDSGDLDNLAEELGDLFLLIAMQSQIAHESGHFSLEDVFSGITTKIVGRHPHVFGEDRAETLDDLSRIWKRAKDQERATRPARRTDKGPDGQPRSMPVFARALRILARLPLQAPSSEPLLNALAGIVAAGRDPSLVLDEALRAHIQQAAATGEYDQNQSRGD